MVDRKDRVKFGIYFTPQNIISYIYDKLENLNPARILEPSCGMGDFIKYCPFKNSQIDCVEIFPYLFSYLCEQEFMSLANIYNADFLHWETQYKYNLIVGNPPYYTIPKRDVSQQYSQYYDGRPNIYIIFIIRALSLLAPNGILAFVLPQNFLSCGYYTRLRRAIRKSYNIIDINEFADEQFYNTQQLTCSIIIQRSNPIRNNEFYYCGTLGTKKRIRTLRKLYHNSVRLNDLGAEVTVGNIVWNQVKDRLTDDGKATLLIYNSDIANGRLEQVNFRNSAKKHYINMPGITSKNIILNRGYGRGKYSFNYSLIDIQKPYLIENHLLIIFAPDDVLEKILISFQDRRTQKFVRLYFMNGAINTNELKYKMPIYCAN